MSRLPPSEKGWFAHYRELIGTWTRHSGSRHDAEDAAQDVAAITAWQRGRLVFRDTPLSRLEAELNRYLREPLRIDDPALARLRVVGTLPIDEPKAVLKVLPRIAPAIMLYPVDGGQALALR